MDRVAGRQTASWSVEGAQANFPMALDAANERVMVVFRRPAELAVLDAREGTVIARLATCGDADDIFFDTSGSAPTSAAVRVLSMSSGDRATPIRARSASPPPLAREPHSSCPNSTGSSWRSVLATGLARRSGFSSLHRRHDRDERPINAADFGDGHRINLQPVSASGTSIGEEGWDLAAAARQVLDRKPISVPRSQGFQERAQSLAKSSISESIATWSDA